MAAATSAAFIAAETMADENETLAHWLVVSLYESRRVPGMPGLGIAPRPPALTDQAVAGLIHALKAS